MALKDPLKERLQAMWTEARRAKDTIEKDWAGAREIIRGEQLAENRPAHKPPAVLNLMRPIIERKTAMLTDTKPRFTVQPTRTGDRYANASKILDDVLNAWWDDSCIDQQLARALLYAQAYGTLIVQTHWSTGRADIVLDVVDPRNFYVDPYVLSADQLADAEYVILEETPPLEQIKMRFPGEGALVRPWVPSHKDTQEGAAARIYQRVANAFRQRTSEATAIKRALVRHYWVKDYSYEDVEIKEEATGRVTKVRRRLYPGGRYIVWAHGDDEGGVVLHDKPNPYADAVHPFDMMEWYMDLDGPWGDSEVQAHRYPQQLLNKLVEVLVENAMLMNNAIWICDQNAFPADDSPKGWGQLTNAPGAIVKKRPGTEVRREYPGGVSTASMGLVTHLEQFIEGKGGGLPEILTRGKAGQMQSGIGAEALQTSASAMIRLKARALESLIQRVGQKCISRVFQFYTNDRVFHVRGEGDEFKEYVFIRKHLTDALEPEALRDAHRDFRFRVSPGSSLSMTKIQKGLVAVQLFQMGAIDRQAVLETIEFPDWKNVLERTKREQAAGTEPVPGAKQKSKRGFSSMERQQKVAGRI